MYGIKIFFILAGILISSELYSQIYINELMASNDHTISDPSYYEYSDWIELYNQDLDTVNISGFFLSDEENNQVKWAFPTGTKIASHDYLIVWADGQDINVHCNFKLSKGGEQLFLYDRDTVLIDQIIFEDQITDVSYGRETDGQNPWILFQEATPGSSNTSSSSFNQASSPQFSLIGGFYDESVSVILSVDSPTAQIRYTLDGSDPDESSSLYSDPLVIDMTTVIRAITVDDDINQSRIVTNSYWINEDIHLPVISISTTGDNLWSDMTGIYVQGTNGIPGRCREEPHNWNQDWEIPIHIEYYDEQGNRGFSQQAGMKIFGGCSRTLPQKSLSIFARNKYGNNRFDYPLFSDLPYDSYKTFVLRNSGNDWNRSMIRDALFTKLTESFTNLDHQAYQPVVVYINGEYWGIQNMREKINEHFLAYHHNVNPDEVNLLERQGVAVHGRSWEYEQLISYINTHDLSEEESYRYVEKEVDIDNFIDYQIVQIYFGNTDWPGNNIKFWRTNDENAKWKWILYDTDFGYALFNESGANHNTMTFATDPDGPGWPNPPWSTLMLRKLLENGEFSRLFVERFNFLLNNAFYPERVLSFIDSMEAGIEAEMPRHIARWHSYDIGYWRDQIDDLRSYAQKRPETILDYVSAYFDLGNTVGLRLQVKEVENGSVSIDDGLQVEDKYTGQFYKNSLVRLHAAPAQGYSFDSWDLMSVNHEWLISPESEWKYLDDGSDQGSTWMTSDFDDESWHTGRGILGYGNGDERTQLSYGSDQDNKFITTYFRKKFNISNPGQISELDLQLMCDDGAVVFINGEEVLRVNMPDGSVQYTTTASATVGGSDEGTYFPYEIDYDNLREGANVIAVEIHQTSKTSSDIRFDVKLTGVSSVSEQVISDNKDLEFYVTGFMNVSANFHDASLVINELHYHPADDAENAFIEVYNQGSSVMNLAGYSFDNAVEFIFPDTARINPGSFIVVAADASRYDTLSCPVYTWSFSYFSEGIDTIRLLDAFGLESDIVVFDTKSPWPSIANGQGPSLELCYPFLDNMSVGSWQESYGQGGSPGHANGITGQVNALRINEALASNKTGIFDKFFDYDDWIEVYNTGNSPVNLGGLYLSDDQSNLMKSKIDNNNPFKTVLPPGGFKVLWADDESTEGALHLDFNLNKSGETLYLSDEQGHLLDSMKFSEQNSDISYGRYNNGEDNFEFFTVPTPGASNNFAPVFDSSPTTTGIEGESYICSFSVNDIEGDPIAIDGLIPSWLTLTDQGDGNAILSGIPGRENTGNFLIKIIASDGKTGPVVQSFILEVETITSLKSLNNAGLKVYPNPFTENLNVSLEDHEGFLELDLLSVSGSNKYCHVVAEGSASSDMLLDLQGLPPGLYILKIVYTDRVYVLKVIKH